MTDPQDWRNYNEYLRRGEALSLWILGMGTAVVIALLVIVSFSDTTNNNTTTASNNAPNATSNSPPRIPPSTTGSGAQPEQLAQFNPGGFGR